MDIKGATFPQSSKIYVQGKLFPEIRVGMREVKIDDPKTPEVPVYDTSGLYGDASAEIDIKLGKSPSSIPARYTFGNSKPFALCMVASVTAFGFSSRFFAFSRRFF